jgi:hypothetical protein
MSGCSREPDIDLTFAAKNPTSGCRMGQTLLGFSQSSQSSKFDGGNSKAQVRKAPDESPGGSYRQQLA